MKRFIYFILFHICGISAICQTVPELTMDDYKGFLKEYLELSAPTKKYKIYVNYGNNINTINTLISGKNLTSEEKSFLFYYDAKIYFDDAKTQLFFEIIHLFDIRGISKVSTEVIEGNTNGHVIIDFNSEYLCKNFDPIENTNVSIDKIELDVNTTEISLEEIKNAFINMAKISGVKNVVDGDNQPNNK